METSRTDVFEDMECFGIAISVFGGLFDTRYKCKARKCISHQQFCELIRCYDK